MFQGSMKRCSRGMASLFEGEGDDRPQGPSRKVLASRGGYDPVPDRGPTAFDLVQPQPESSARLTRVGRVGDDEWVAVSVDRLSLLPFDEGPSLIVAVDRRERR